MTREEIFQNLSSFDRVDAALAHEDDRAIALESMREIMLWMCDNGTPLENRLEHVMDELVASGLLERAGKNFYMSMPEDFEPEEA